MPGLNQTGPMGQGPMTGRRMGRCTNFGAARMNKDGTSTETPAPEQVNDFRGSGRGFGRRWNRCGRGLGPGLQNRFRNAW